MAGTVPACVDQWYNTAAEARACEKLAEQETDQDFAVEEKVSEEKVEYFRNNFLRKYQGVVTTVYHREPINTSERKAKKNADQLERGSLWNDVSYYQFHRYRAYNVLDRYAQNTRTDCDNPSETPSYFFDRSQAQEWAIRVERVSGVPRTLEVFDACRISDSDRSSPLYSQHVSLYGVGPESAYRVVNDRNALTEYANKWRTAHGIELGVKDFITETDAEIAARAEETRTNIPHVILYRNYHWLISKNPLYRAYESTFGTQPLPDYTLEEDSHCADGAKYEVIYSNYAYDRANACAESLTRMLGQPFETVKEEIGVGDSKRTFFEVTQKDE